MDCNREEAIRAKGLAAMKMENRDFVSAQKLALKAQRLYPDLENISQMRLVCDVLCSGENEVYGNEKHWYAILQIEPSADEASIRKQYRKFALSLHPDKNKFVGASDAFKLIAEAQKVLLDREKRMLYDSKLKAAGRSLGTMWKEQKTGMQSNAERQPRHQNNFRNNVASQFPHQQHHQFVNNRSTFWTVCPFCSVRYQYYKEVIHKVLICQNCKKYFKANEMNNPSSTFAANCQPGFSQQKEPTSQDNSKVGSQGTEKSNSKMETERNVGPENCSDLKTGCTSKGGEGFKPSEESRNVEFRSKELGQSGEPNSRRNKKRKTVVDSSESCESERRSDIEDLILEDGDNVVPKSSECNSEQHTRGSNRPRGHVSHDVNLKVDGSQSPPKRSKPNGSSHGTAEEIDVHGTKKEGGCFVDVEGYEKQVKGKQGFPDEKDSQNGEKDAERAYKKMDGHGDDKKTSSLTSESCSSSTDPEVYQYPDPEFSNFDNDRKEESFAVGQIWAVYDNLDAMPRFYALINKVFSPGFKVRITWLDPDPDDEEEIKWVEDSLPVSCGKFRRGSTEYTEDHPMFSHLVSWEKVSSGRYKIHPRKGETWALFKDWDINWHSDLEAKEKYAYELVEVLSDYIDDVGVYVAFLAKVKGFACLFCRRTSEAMNSVLISAKAIFRFSHRVPSFQLGGNERDDIPEGSFELDPASLPTSKDGTVVSEDLEVEIHTYGSCPQSLRNMAEPKAKSEKNATQVQKAEAKAEFDRNASIFSSVEIKAKCKGNESLDHVVRQEGQFAKISSSADMVKPKPEFAGSTSLADMVQPMTKSEGNLTPNQADKKIHLDSNESDSDNMMEDCFDSPASGEEFYEVPEPEFYNFDLDKSPGKFQIGQIWAIYSDEDTLPKYYGKIKRIDHGPVFQLHVTWLEACPPPKDIVSWLNDEMIICCGRFKLMKGKPDRYTDTNPFSHLLRAEQTETKNVYAIFPRKGEVWALYRNWNAGMRVSDLDNCKYDIVEVVEENDFCITVLALELVDGFQSVFRPQMKGRRSNVTVQISQAELLRFSHQIPAFRLTEEKGGSLRGFWELDTAALPALF